MLRAEAEAWWSLGERAQAEARYEALMARMPNFAWGYIGLADCYWLGPEPRRSRRSMRERKRSTNVP